MIALNDNHDLSPADRTPDKKRPGTTAPTTGRLSVVRPDMPAPAPEVGDVEPVPEAKFDPQALLAEQDAEVEFDLELLAVQHTQEVQHEGTEVEFALEADEDWYEQVLHSQQVGAEAKKRTSLEDAKGEGWVSPDVLADRATRAEKRSRWQVIGVVLFLVAALCLVVSIVLASGGAS